MLILWNIIKVIYCEKYPCIRNCTEYAQFAYISRSLCVFHTVKGKHNVVQQMQPRCIVHRTTSLFMHQYESKMLT